MKEQTLFCDECATEGLYTFAGYVLCAETAVLEEPLVADPPYLLTPLPQWHALCEQHYREIPANARAGYSHIEYSGAL